MHAYPTLTFSKLFIDNLLDIHNVPWSESTPTTLLCPLPHSVSPLHWSLSSFQLFPLLSWCHLFYPSLCRSWVGSVGHCEVMDATATLCLEDSFLKFSSPSFGCCILSSLSLGRCGRGVFQYQTLHCHLSALWWVFSFPTSHHHLKICFSNQKWKQHSLIYGHEHKHLEVNLMITICPFNTLY